MTKSVCFVIMPFGRKPDAAGRQIDFDAVHDEIIAPAIAAAGFNGVRADKEMSAGMIHKAMFERLILSEYAIADLTILNANVYYELGVRHAARPQTTVLLSAEASRLPFDVGPLSAMPYSLDSAGRPNKAEADRAALVEKLIYCKNHDAPDSPLFTLLDGFAAPQVDHEKTDIFRREVNRAQELKEKLHTAKAKDIAALDALRDELGDIAAREAGVVIDLFLAYRAIKAWDRMIALYKTMDPVLANTALAREQYAFALNRSGRGAEAERVLEELIAKRGPSSETYGLLGRVHKDRWREARAKQDAIAARGFLKKAIAAYRKGFEADWRDAFPGVNAVTLMEIPQSRRSRGQGARAGRAIRGRAQDRARRGRLLGPRDAARARRAGARRAAHRRGPRRHACGERPDRRLEPGIDRRQPPRHRRRARGEGRGRRPSRWDYQGARAGALRPRAIAPSASAPPRPPAIQTGENCKGSCPSPGRLATKPP